ncbi:MAG: hypothetical protein ACOYXS_04830 [Chloroflexota bacterium]
MVSLTFLLLLGAIGLLALIPTRRLYLAGWSPRALALYYVGLVALALIVAELRAPARFLLPILVVAYIAPFVTARAGLRRLFGRSERVSSPIVSRPATRGLPPPAETGETPPPAAPGPGVGRTGPPAAGPEDEQTTDRS